MIHQSKGTEISFEIPVFRNDADFCSFGFFGDSKEHHQIKYRIILQKPTNELRQRVRRTYERYRNIHNEILDTAVLTTTTASPAKFLLPPRRICRTSNNTRPRLSVQQVNEKSVVIFLYRQSGRAPPKQREEVCPYFEITRSLTIYHRRHDKNC